MTFQHLIYTFINLIKLQQKSTILQYTEQQKNQYQNLRKSNLSNFTKTQKVLLMKDVEQNNEFDPKIPIQIYHRQQTYRDKIGKFLQDYLRKISKEKLLETMKIMCYSYQSQGQTLSYFHRLITELNKILNENHTFRSNITQKTKINLTFDQQQKLNVLIKSYETRIINQLMTFMRTNSLLQPIKSSKLEQIVRSYKIITIPKKQILEYKSDNRQIINLYYLLQGDVEKTRYYFFHDEKDKIFKNNEIFSLKNALQKANDKNLQSKDKNINSKVDINESRFSRNKLNNLSVSLASQSDSKTYPLNSFLTKRKSLSRNTLKTLIQTGQFIGDEFFNNADSDYVFPTMTKFLVISEKAVLIKFQGQLIKKILDQYNYYEDSKPFYHQKSSIQLKQIHSLRIFDKKYHLICQKKQQNQLKRHCSPQIQEMKKIVLKRYVTSNSQSQVDINSPKRLSSILNKRRKKMNINRKNNFQLPMVQVFSTYSQKRRSHQNVALSPMAIVKTNKNSQLLNKPDNIISQNQKSQIYQIKSWQNSSSLKQQQLSPSMKQLHQVVKHKKHHSGGFQLLQLQRVLEKIKVNLKKR